MQRILPKTIFPALLIVLTLLGLVQGVQNIHAQEDQPALAALVADPYEPNDDPAHATPIQCGANIAAVIQRTGDVDYFSFSGLAGQLIVADTDAWGIDGSLLDSVLTLFDSDGTTVLEENDEMAWGSYDSHIEFTLPHNGTFYLMVQDWFLDGGPDYTYAISLSCNGPREIAVTPNSFEVNLPPGSSQTRTLTIQNLGPGTLNWGLSEQDTTPAAPAYTSLDGTVQILSWVRFTGINYLNVEYEHTLEAIEQYFLDFTVTESNALDPAALAAALVDKDVLLLPQPNQATNEELEAAGSALQATLQAFVSSGHMIIATGEWMDFQGFLRSAALLDAQYADHCATGCTWILPVVDADHPLAVGLGDTAQGSNSTTSYVIGDSDVQVVVTSPAGQPVVIARDIGAGHVVLIGYDYYEYNNDAARIIANAVQWAQIQVDVPWLSAVPTSGGVVGAGNQQIVVTLDAAGLAVDTYTANLLILNDDIDENLVTVPVTLHVGSAPSILGDVNGDGVANSTDALIILSADVGIGTAQFCPMNCGDVNGDTQVNSTDALIILSYDVGITVPYAVGVGACPSSVTPPAGCNPSAMSIRRVDTNQMTAGPNK